MIKFFVKNRSYFRLLFLGICLLLTAKSSIIIAQTQTDEKETRKTEIYIDSLPSILVRFETLPDSLYSNLDQSIRSKIIRHCQNNTKGDKNVSNNKEALRDLIGGEIHHIHCTDDYLTFRVDSIMRMSFKLLHRSDKNDYLGVILTLEKKPAQSVIKIYDQNWNSIDLKKVQLIFSIEDFLNDITKIKELWLQLFLIQTPQLTYNYRFDSETPTLYVELTNLHQNTLTQEDKQKLLEFFSNKPIIALNWKNNLFINGNKKNE